MLRIIVRIPSNFKVRSFLFQFHILQQMFFKAPISLQFLPSINKYLLSTYSARYRVGTQGFNREYNTVHLGNGMERNTI